MDDSNEIRSARLLQSGIAVIREMHGTGDRIYVENIRCGLVSASSDDKVTSVEARIVGDRLTHMGLLTKHIAYLDHNGRIVATAPFLQPLDPKKEIYVIMLETDDWEGDDAGQMVEAGLLRTMDFYRKEPEVGKVIYVIEPEQLLTLEPGTYLVENAGSDTVGDAPVHRVVTLQTWSQTQYDTPFLAVVDGKNRPSVRHYFTFDATDHAPERVWTGLKFIKINIAAFFNQR